VNNDSTGRRLKHMGRVRAATLTALMQLVDVVADRLYEANEEDELVEYSQYLSLLQQAHPPSLPLEQE